jgi:hypothetical protein
MTGNGADRRQSVRVLTPHTAVWIEAPRLEALSLIDLSTGGALIAAARDLKKVETMRLLLSLDSAGPVPLDARVVRGPRRRGRTSEVAVAFAKLDESAAHLVTATVLSCLSARLREARREVLVIDRSSAVRRAIREALDLFGVQDITEGSSPLDAVAHLIRDPIQRLTSFVGAPAGSVGAVDLATFIAGEYPHVHVVLLIPNVESPNVVAVPSEAHTNYEILAKPWSPERVASFMLPRHLVAA